MKLSELFSIRGLTDPKEIKIVRHKDKRYDVHVLERDGYLPEYTSYQAERIFGRRYAAVFLGGENTKAVLWRVYEVGTRYAASVRYHPNILIETGLPWPNTIMNLEKSEALMTCLVV